MAAERPELTDGVVRLRRHIDDDIDAMVEMCRDPEFARWTNVPQPYDRDHARQFAHEIVPEGWKTGDWRGWAIEAVDDAGQARFAGNVDIRGEPVADIGFGLHPWARSRGLMSRAIRLATRWVFDHTDIRVVHWRSDVGNVTSRRVAWSSGFSFHGTVPRLLYERGEVVDAWIGSLHPDDSGEPRTRWLVPPVLSGERAVLRPFRDTDAPRIVESCSDPRTQHWLAGLPRPYTEADARQWMVGRVEAQSLGRGVWWCVADPDSDELVANVSVFGLRGDDPSSAEVGYWAHPDARGRGVVTEAVGLVLRHAFVPTADGGLGLRRLQLAAGLDNSASHHVATRNGFTEVGRHREAERLGDGSYTDLVWYDRLSADP